MTALEDRIRAGLSADRAVPDLYDAVRAGARRRRARRTAGGLAAAVLAVIAVLAGVTISTGGNQKPAPVETPTPRPTPTKSVPNFPAASENVVSTASSGDRVFVLTESRTLWTYADGEWTAEKDLPIPDQAEINFSPNGRNGVIEPRDWTDQAFGEFASADFAVTTDGGRTWSSGTAPVPCGCGATATDTGFFYLGSTTSPQGVSSDPVATGVYRSADGQTDWVRTGPAPFNSLVPTHLFARGNALVASTGRGFAVSTDEGHDWRILPQPCRTVGRGFDAAYTFDTGLATGEEIVVNCHPGEGFVIETKNERRNQVVHTVDLARWEPIGPPVDSTLCCFPISDDAAVGADLLVTAAGARQIDLPLDTHFWGVHAARSGGVTYLAFLGQLWVSYDDGLAWTQLTRGK
jgi:hypothetical protein